MRYLFTILLLTNFSFLFKIHCSEPVFVNLLRSPGFDSQLDNPFCRSGPLGYISCWRNRFRGIDSWTPKAFTNTGSEQLEWTNWAVKSVVGRSACKQVVYRVTRLISSGEETPPESTVLERLIAQAGALKWKMSRDF